MRELQEYISIGQKRLRCGYTTGTCAAAAARAAAELLAFNQVVPAVTVRTPAGVDVVVDVEENEVGAGWAQCAVRKDSGDDPDVTDGVLVHARVERIGEPGIRIEGGLGVGRITREGLDQPVGEAAINSTPRKMIEQQVREVLSALGSDGGGGARDGAASSSGSSVGGQGGSSDSAQGSAGSGGHEGAALRAGDGVLVTVSIPQGVELAARTFNPRLGIEGGISVIGTSGIVRPMSEDALIASIKLEMRMLAARGVRDLLVVPGNYGRDFACGQLLLSLDDAVQCSNYFGDTLDAACVLGFERVLIVGHIGKMAKVAGGIMNTHSRIADCRVEVLAAHGALAGADRGTVRGVMEAATTDAALGLLDACGLMEPAMQSLIASLADKLDHRVAGQLQVEAVVFSNVHGILGMTPGASALIERFA